MPTHDEIVASAEAKYAASGYGGRRRPRGRKVLPLSERKTLVSVNLNPAEREQALELGTGNLSAGIRKALSLVRDQKAAALNAIRGAAESRDQTALTQVQEDATAPGSAFD
jgi:hypothetical protein